MSYTSYRLLPRQRQSTTLVTNVRDEEVGLTQSLSQLSIINDAHHQPEKSSSRRSSFASNPPLRPPPQRSSSTASRPRNPSRSPSNGPTSRAGSRAGTPPLLRKASMNSLHSASGTASRKPSFSRRASNSQLMSPTASKIAPEDEKPPVTANSIASEYFRAELEAHHGPVATLPTDTVVILNDAVYGHRFSRPRTSRNALKTIVERPERIKAAVLGVSTAYVRLGGRHCQGHTPIRAKTNVLEVDSIPFRIHKTTRRIPLTSSIVTNVHGTRWMEELKVMCDSAESTLAMGGKELQRQDISRGPDNDPPQQLHEGDLYLCAESLNAMEGALGAVCEAVDTVFLGNGPRKAFVAVRPPGHHCSASHPSGFCWVNNVHVGIMHGALSHGLTHATIIDFDLHHGDGSQAITWDHNSRANGAKKNEAQWKKTSIGYFSLHDINSYPCEWGDMDKVKNASVCIDSAHGQSIWNVHLQAWKTEQEFWTLYESTYSVLLDKTRKYLRQQARKVGETGQRPKAAIFLSAGFDASEWEGAGMQRHKVNVPTEFYARVTQDIVKLAAEEGLAVDGRVISVLEGGYSDRALCSGILSHLSGMVGDMDTSSKAEREASGLGHEMGQKIGLVNASGGEMAPEPLLAPTRSYNPSWWASDQLEQLEQTTELPPPPVKPRDTTPPTYTSPTQASTARVTDPSNMRRSLSSISTGQTRIIQQPPSPPPSEVSWVIAAKELCNALIPADRQTDSYRAEELNAEASRARRERQSILLGLPSATPPPPTPSAGGDRPSSRISLRDRRSRVIGPIDEETSETLTRARRKSTATPVASPAKAIRGTTQAQSTATQSARRPNRRLSSASTTLSPPREAASPGPSVPATAPIPRRTTTSRPTSRSSGVQGHEKAPTLKQRSASTRKDATAKSSRAVKDANAGKQLDIVDASTLTTSTDRPSSVASRGHKSDMDHLATGLKKIRINLITPSQKEARERARARLSENAADEQRGTPQDGVPTVEARLSPTPAAGGVEGMSFLPQTPAEELSAEPALSCVGNSLQAPAPPTPSLSGEISSPAEVSNPSTLSSPYPNPARPVLVHPVSYPSPERPHLALHSASDSHDLDTLTTPHQAGGIDSVTKSNPSQPLNWLPPVISPLSVSAGSPTESITPLSAQSSGLFAYQQSAGIPFAPRPEGPARKASASAQKQPDLKATRHSLWGGTTGS
ncbi:hypothetical protein E4U13_004049 [Claviceps humidiphila]|uniref:Histone deacetylase domain-containing protein n=1 Tax=Claviceps humidiphila TaxID=1294629 RepID=A0A9P7TW41_9HYPO|nr:hypothetical protein E4U13_004049 [Claviceps humidiphila]